MKNMRKYANNKDQICKICKNKNAKIFLTCKNMQKYAQIDKYARTSSEYAKNIPKYAKNMQKYAVYVGSIQVLHIYAPETLMMSDLSLRACLWVAGAALGH